MAEMNVPESGGKKKGGVKRTKKMSTRVDMTPMVDLGFLLITFFMLTTTFSKPQAMELNMPAEPPKGIKQPEVKESKVLNLILSENHKIIFTYRDPDAARDPQVDSIDFSVTKNIRPVLAEKAAYIKQKFQNEEPDKRDMIVLIKPKSTSTYADLVNLLDEMSITDTKRYAIVNYTPVDSMTILTGRVIDPETLKPMNF